MTPALRYALAFALSFGAVAALTPVAARIARRLGLVAHPRRDRHAEDPTPFLGGLAIGVGLLLAAAVATPAREPLLGMGLGVIVIGLLGLADDVRGLGPWVRLAVEGLAGLALWVGGIRAGFFHVEVLDLMLTVLWVMTLTNAVNILDNMDGVATGVVAIAALGFFVMAASQGDYLVGSFALALAGGCLGFLLHNFPPAKVFMGDAGSLMLGFLLAVLSLKLDAATPHALVRAVVAVLAVGVPLFDLALVVIARSRGGRPIFQGGLDHAAHRLSAGGLSKRHVALAAFVSQAFATGGALITYQASALSGVFAAAVGSVVTALLLVAFLRMETLPHTGPGSMPEPPERSPADA